MCWPGPTCQEKWDFPALPPEPRAMLPTLPAQELSLLSYHAAAGSPPILAATPLSWHRLRNPGKIPNLCFGFLRLLAAPVVPEAGHAEVANCSHCPLPQPFSFFCTLL